MAFDWKGVLNTVAPTLATALGGPLAGAAVTAIAAVLGISNEGNDQKTVEDQIAGILAAPNPEILLKLKEADNQFRIDMERLEIDLEKIHQEDRASARQRQVMLKDETPAILALLLTVGFFGALAAHIFWDVPIGNQTLLNVMLGSLGTAWTTSMSYFFGTSIGSKTKQELLDKALGGGK